MVIFEVFPTKYKMQSLKMCVTILLQILLVQLVNCTFSGFYVDNGIGQTVLQESIPQADAHLMRQHILELLGLPDRSDTERFPTVIRLVLFNEIGSFFFQTFKSCVLI